MFNNIPNIFGKKFIYENTNRIYNGFRLNFLISLVISPWIVLNIFLRLTSETVLIYGLLGIVLYPAVLSVFEYVSDGIIGKTFFHYWKKNFWKGIKIGLLANTLILFVLVEIQITLKNPTLFHLLPVYASMLFFLIVAFWYLSFFLIEEKLDWRSIKKSLFLSWRFLFTTIKISIYTVIWLGMFYFIPSINLFGGSALFLIFIFKILKRKISVVFTDMEYHIRQ